MYPIWNHRPHPLPQRAFHPTRKASMMFQQMLNRTRSLFSDRNCLSIVNSSTLSLSSPVISSELNDSNDINKLFSLRTEYHSHPLIGSLTLSSISPSLPECGSPAQVSSPFSSSNLTSNVSKTSPDLSYSASSIGSMQENISSDRGHL